MDKNPKPKGKRDVAPVPRSVRHPYVDRRVGKVNTRKVYRQTAVWSDR